MAGLRQAVYHETPSEPPEELEPWYRISKHLVVQRAQHQDAGRFRARRDSDGTSNLTAYDAASALPSVSPLAVRQATVAGLVKLYSVPGYHARYSWRYSIVSVR